MQAFNIAIVSPQISNTGASTLVSMLSNLYSANNKKVCIIGNGIPISTYNKINLTEDKTLTAERLAGMMSMGNIDSDEVDGYCYFISKKSQVRLFAPRWEQLMEKDILSMLNYSLRTFKYDYNIYDMNNFQNILTTPANSTEDYQRGYLFNSNGINNSQYSNQPYTPLAYYDFITKCNLCLMVLNPNKVELCQARQHLKYFYNVPTIIIINRYHDDLYTQKDIIKLLGITRQNPFQILALHYNPIIQGLGNTGSFPTKYLELIKSKDSRFIEIASDMMDILNAIGYYKKQIKEHKVRSLKGGVTK